MKNAQLSTVFLLTLLISVLPAPAFGGMLDKQVAETILARVRADRLTRDRADLEVSVGGYLADIQPDGSFGNCHYVSRFRNDGAVLAHLERLREMAIAYTQAGSRYCGDDALYAHIVKGLEYWYDRHWTDHNWWQNRIAHPQRLGEVLIAMYYGEKDIRSEPIFGKLIGRWREELGDPDTPRNPTTAGANKCDIAMHWMYRACLTLDKEELTKAADRSFLIVDYTTGEGLQHDGSFQQHGAQLYIGGYGAEFIQLVARQAFYLADTEYALSPEKLEIFSNFVRGTFLKTIRGKRMSFSVLGRGVTRTDNTNRSDFTKILDMLISVDPDHAHEYEAAIGRLNGEKPTSYTLQSSHTYYYRSEYTLHQRPGYTFDVRMASKRLARDEYDINENRQGFFLSDGATGIYVDGEEYGSILPVWDWKKIPGTTVPDLAVMRRADRYIFNGRSACAGGVTDGAYGVTAFDMVNDQELYAADDDKGFKGVPEPVGERLPALDFGARKSWFMFDREIVCLGAGIYSGHDEPVYTTVNQCRQAGDAVVASAGGRENVGKDTFIYSKVEWALNDKVAYFFPDRPSLHVVNETRTGSWRDINNGGSPDRLTADIFTLWLDHGVKPQAERYAYVIVPNIQSAEEAASYPISDIEILANNDTIQAVYHRRLDRYGLTFFKAGVFKGAKFTVKVTGACAVMLKQADPEKWMISAAELQDEAITLIHKL
jgi:chondroitin AC lyase